MLGQALPVAIFLNDCRSVAWRRQAFTEAEFHPAQHLQVADRLREVCFFLFVFLPELLPLQNIVEQVLLRNRVFLVSSFRFQLLQRENHRRDFFGLIGVFYAVWQKVLAADLRIAKDQANAEALEDQRDFFILFMCKCELVAKTVETKTKLPLKLGDLVLQNTA
mgnify:CR=1 FL=1